MKRLLSFAILGMAFSMMADAQILPQYWINFVKTGNPNGQGLPYWTTFKQGEATVMDFNNGFHLIKTPNQPQMVFWEEYFKSLR